MFESIQQFFTDSLIENTISGTVAGVLTAAILAIFGFIWHRRRKKSPKFTGKTNDVKLPAADSKLVGRDDELELLDMALEDDETKVFVLVAGTGTGKTMLVKKWLDGVKLSKLGETVMRIYGWSFQHQSDEYKFTSSEDFLRDALDYFDNDRDDLKEEHKKGEYLAKLINTERTILVLDGLEVFQPIARDGDVAKINAPAIFTLLKTLVFNNVGLCIITMRESLDKRLLRLPGLVQHQLTDLSQTAAIELLEQKGVTGKPEQLQKVVREYSGHAFSLNLLAHYLLAEVDGDITKRDTLPNLMQSDKKDDSNQRARQIMATYAASLKNTPELILLYAVAVFEYPVGKDLVIRALKGINSKYQSFINRHDAERLYEPVDWKQLCQTLNDAGLLIGDGEQGKLTLHSIMRDFFRADFKAKFPSQYKRAHLVLCDYYKGLAKELPGNLKEMRPLFRAVVHGCAAGRHQQVMEEVYFPRIKRSAEENYLCSKLGAFSDDLAVVANFFSQSWLIPSSGLDQYWQADVLNWAGFRLQALGRLNEAVEPTRASVESYKKLGNWEYAAKAVSTLSEIQLTLGYVADAMHHGEFCMAYSDQSGDAFVQSIFRVTYAKAILQAGNIDEASAMFKKAEELQQVDQPDYPRFYSISGFEYCELLLSQGQLVEAMERAEYALVLVKQEDWLLEIALHKLTLGNAHHTQGDLKKAHNWLEQAVSSLREAGTQHHLPRGLLARAALYRDTEKFDLAQQDLAEVKEIAEAGEMRLFVTDYHLEMARLLLASKGEGNVQYHITEADHLIQETGYHRRDPELATLKQQLAP